MNTALMRQTLAKLIVAAMMCLLFTALLTAQAQNGKKSHTLRGKVEAVDASAKSLTVNHGNVEGWMNGMTMKYKIDNSDIFNSVKTGDTIEATVFDGDYTLYNVHVVPAEQKK
jgi:Cu/Ag efflux protein CusF